MSDPGCVGICEAVRNMLGEFGFKFNVSEDHTDMFEALGKVKFVLIHPEDKERVWPLWNLTDETIRAIAREKGLTLAGKDFDEIARVTKKGIDAALDFVWEEAVKNAIKITEAEWVFRVVSHELSERSVFTSGRIHSCNETWAGEIECKSGDTSFVLNFELVHLVTEDNGGDTARITSSKPDEFNEEAWDDLTYAMMDFIETTYRAEHWD
jgi:hypothetical protein